MPVGLEEWCAGIASTRYCFFAKVCVDIPFFEIFLSSWFSFAYLYLFVLVALVTIPFSVLAVSAWRGIGIIRYLSKYVLRDVLDQIYKLYVRPHLDYSDIIYHKNDPDMKLDFIKRLEQTQYSAALAVTGAWRGTSRQRLYEELGWESLYHRRWFRRLSHFYNLKKTQSPAYLFDEIPSERQLVYSLRNPRIYDQGIVRTNRFSNFSKCAQ